MTSTPTQQQPDHQAARGPERFAVRPAAPARPSLGKAAGAALALLALLVGIPAALWALSGPPPLPSGLPGRDDLTQPLTVDALLTVLAAVVWLAWLQFAVCTVVELVSLVRGGGLPRPVPLSGRSQALARALVGTLLVGTSLLGSTGAATAATAAPEQPTGPATVQVVDDRGERDAADGRQALAAEGDEATAGGRAAPRMEAVPGVPQEMTDVIGHKVAIVQPPDGSYHDNLWDIAERHLGDGRRWKQVFELNQGRVQPDGQQLELGRLIQPGWVLIMPDDARGLPRVHALPDEAPAPPSTPDDAPLEAPGDSDSGPDGVLDRAGDRLGVGLTGGLLGAVLVGALAAERRRRRGVDPGDDALEAEVQLLVGADADRVVRLDRALRSLSATCRAERVALPQAYAATVDDDAVELRVAPPSTAAPAPWSALDDGARWRLDRDAAEAAEGDGAAEVGHAPYPGLVCLGRDDAGADVLVDLEAVAGPLAVGGASEVAREVVSALAVQLATAPWADDQQVWGHGLAPVLAEVAGSPLRAADDLDALLADWADRSPRRDADEVLGGRLGRHPGAAPQYLALGAQPGPDALARLDALVAGGGRGVGVVSAVPLPSARWRLEVDEAGRLAVPLLDLEVDAVRLTSAASEELAALFAAARREDEPTGDDRPRVPTPPQPTDDGHWGSAAVRVGLLGPLEVRADGRLDPSRLALATEVVVFLAAQPAPVHPSVVGASVWPRGVTAEVRDATIARTRDWLGADADGNPLLRETAEGRLHLAPDVAVDWWALCSLLQRAREAGPRDERELLRRALQLVRGEVLADRPAGRYAWLPRTRLERQAADLVVDAAHRLAERSFDDDPSGAAAACRAGLRLAPTSQVLWRDLLRAEDRRPDGPGTAAVVDEAVQALHAAGATLEAETEALVVELLPGHRPEETA